MYVILYNLDWQVKESYHGTFSKAAFHYKINQINIPIINRKILGEDHEQPMDYNKTYLLGEGGERVAYYHFDGKDWKQLKLEDIPEKGTPISVSDFLRTEEEGKRKINEMIQEPNLVGYAKMLGYIALAIVIIAATYNAQTLQHISDVQFGILNSSLTTNNKLLTLCLNQTHTQTLISQTCISTLQNVSRSCISKIV